MRGGGSVIGVIQLLNKKEGNEFDGGDEQLLMITTQKIADDLSEKFKHLTQIADKFAGSAIFVGGKGGDISDHGKVAYEQPTKSVLSRAASYNDSKNTSPRADTGD